MIRALSILAAVVALAVSAAPVGSAGPVKKPPPRSFDNTPMDEVAFLKAARPKAGPSKAKAPRPVLAEEMTEALHA